MSVDVKTFTEIVKTRRSIRKYLSEPVPENVMRECLELALLSPNSSNLQPWEFYWVRSPEKKKKVIVDCFNQSAAATAAEIIIAVARTKTWRKHAKQIIASYTEKGVEAPEVMKTYYKKIVPLAYTVGPFGILTPFKKILFGIIGLFRPAPREPSSLGELKTWAVKSTALACQTLMLAFRAYGYDTCPMEGLDSKRIKKHLNLPCDAVVVMGISVGKRAEAGVYGERFRFPSVNFIKEV